MRAFRFLDHEGHNPVKPVNLNQLLFHPKASTLSFFLAPIGKKAELTEVDDFIVDMLVQLHLQELAEIAKLLEKYTANIKKIIRSHPEQSHGFYLSEKLHGYVIFENVMEPYCIMGSTFHVRPLLEEVFVNPEFMVVNISLYDIKIYRGDFKHLDIIQHYEFDQLAKGFNAQERSRVYNPQYLGLIPYKSILAMKTIAYKVMDLILYQSMPVIVTGLDEMKKIFLRYFDQRVGVITHFQDDFYEKTCVEISEKCRAFRPVVMDYYSAQLKERLKRMVKSKRLITELGPIIKAASEGKIVHLVLPTDKKLWGLLDFETGDFEIHKKLNKKTSVDILNELAEEVIKRGGKIQILGPHFFPEDAQVLAILKG